MGYYRRTAVVLIKLRNQIFVQTLFVYFGTTGFVMP